MAKTYFIKEIFYTLQGEGANSGRPSVFCRFTGCNLWTGLEQDRERAICRFCDTEFVGTDGDGGGRFEGSEAAAAAIRGFWPNDAVDALPFVVCTGGEPLLQLDEPLIASLHHAGFEVAVETNGTCAAPPGLDWICVSPKAGAPLVIDRANELKLVYPQESLCPSQLDGFRADYRFLQPMDGPHRERNTQLAIEYCLKHPRWRLSLQTHKIIGLR